LKSKKEAEEHIQTYIRGVMRSIAILQQDDTVRHALAIQRLRKEIDKVLYECRRNADANKIIDELGIKDIE